ncbi:MAG: diacylglycerol kinase family lipid kinase [Gammaproteobacteria bacterium]|nr:diacylglycerol kinase family lipid kinase [Gammaproteobacteria bacterium]
MKNIQLIINPHAGRGDGARTGPEIARELTRRGFDCEARLTNERGHAVELAREAAANGADCVAIAGGDGSIHEAVNGLMQSGCKTPLAIMPVGTGNDFAKMFGSPSWQTVCAQIADGQRRHVDIGRCNGRYFTNGIGIGFDAKVADIANNIGWLRGKAVYGVALAKVLAFHHDNPSVRITTDDHTFVQPITLLAAANGRVYGGSFRISPQASIADGALDIVIAANFSRLRIMQLVPHVLRGTHLGLPGVRFLRTRKLLVESREALTVHADGEMLEGDNRRLEIELLPGRLSVIG